MDYRTTVKSNTVKDGSIAMKLSDVEICVCCGLVELPYRFKVSFLPTILGILPTRGEHTK